jgi:hypothetical protein
MSLSRPQGAAGLTDRTITRALGAALVVWLGVVVVLGRAGWFVTPPGEPSVRLLAGVTLPVALFVVVYGASGRFREYVRAGDPRLLTTLQSWRVLGGTFLVLLSFGLLPAAFAVPAGWGDIAIGLTAPFVALALAGGGPRWAGRLFVGWQILGLLDLIVAVGTGAALRSGVGATGDPAAVDLMLIMSQLPLGLVPTFAVPLFVIFHLASLAQYRARVLAAGGSEDVAEGRDD